MFKVAPTLKLPVPPTAKVGVTPALWLKAETVIEDVPLESVAVVGNIIEYADPAVPVTLKAAALMMPPNVLAPPVTVKALPVVNTAVPPAADAATVPKLIGLVWLMAIGVAIVALAVLVTLAALAIPEDTRVARATAEAIFKEICIF